MADEKDRLGDTLHKKEKAEENQYFQQQEKAAIERLRQQKAAAQGAPQRDAALNRCPRCGATLASTKLQDVAVDECPAGHGMWLDKGALELVANRERDSWLGRTFFRPRL